MRFVALDPAPVATAFGVLTRPVPADLATLCGDSPSRFRRMDRYNALAFAAAHLALSTAPARPREKGDPDWGLLLGSSLGCWSSNAQYFRDLEQGPAAELSPALFARTVSNAVNGEISIAHQIGGASQMIVSGWAAGGEALAEAAALLLEKRVVWVLAGGIEAPDETLQRMHAARRQEQATAWLPEGLAEGAGICVLTHPLARVPGQLVVRAYWRGHDPCGTWSLSAALSALRPLSVTTIVVANTVPPGLLEQWQEEAEGANIVNLPLLTGEIGAAGAPVAMAFAERSNGRVQGQDCALVIARGIEGGTVALALGR